MLPHVIDFLDKLRDARQQVWLVTNAHRDSLNLKIEKTCLHRFFDDIISSHDLGIPKEHPDFWGLLQKRSHFNQHRSVLVDDNLSVLNAAKAFGISHLIAISRPDSQQPKKLILDYPAIEDFRELMSTL